MKAKIAGVASSIFSSEFDFTKYHSMLNNFSIALQKGSLSACEGQTFVHTNFQAIKSVWSFLDFDLLWKYIKQRSSEIKVCFNA